MSSMKSFKSRLSNKRENSKSKINVSVSQSQAQYNLKNVFMNIDKNLQFKLHKVGQKMSVVPVNLQITNHSGARIFLHILASKNQYFNISPKKYILENGNSYQVTINLIQIPYVRFEDYEAQTIQINWGKITQEQIANKIIPFLTESKSYTCSITNKNALNQLMIQKTYASSKNNVRQHISQNNFLNVEGTSNNILQVSRASQSNKRQQFARSGLNESDLKIKDSMFEERESLLRTNVIIAVALVSFVIGFISA